MDKRKDVFQDPLETYPCPLGYCRCEYRTEGNSLKCRYTVDDRNVDNQCVCEREGQYTIYRYYIMLQELFLEQPPQQLK